jgi:hypothetical protein
MSDSLRGSFKIKFQVCAKYFDFREYNDCNKWKPHIITEVKNAHIITPTAYNGKLFFFINTTLAPKIFPQFPEKQKHVHEIKFFDKGLSF